MNCRILNNMLLDYFPELKESFEEETSWQEGIDTGSTVVYEDVFMKFLFEQIDKNNEYEIKRGFDFIEKLAELSDDEYVKQLILVCIFENLVSHDSEINYRKWFGPKTTELESKFNMQ